MFNPTRAIIAGLSTFFKGSDVINHITKDIRSHPPKSINKTRTRALKGQHHASQKARSNRRKASKK